MLPWIRLDSVNYSLLAKGHAIAYYDVMVDKLYIGYVEKITIAPDMLHTKVKRSADKDFHDHSFAIDTSEYDSLLSHVWLYSSFYAYTPADISIERYLELEFMVYQSPPIKAVNTGIEFVSVVPTEGFVNASSYIGQNTGPVGHMSSQQKARSVDYRFCEDGYINELKTYIDATYGAHYSGKVSPMDLMISGGQALGFIVGSIIKYAFRLGKKDNYKRDDVLKIAHYSVLLLYVYDALKLGDKKDE